MEHDNTSSQKPLKTSLPVNSCFLYTSHSHLIVRHVLARVGRKFWVFFLECGVWKKQVNIALDLSTLPETESSVALLMLPLFSVITSIYLLTEKSTCLLPSACTLSSLTMLHSGFFFFQLASTFLITTK